MRCREAILNGSNLVNGVHDMAQNLGDADRTVRMLIGGVLAILFFQLPDGTVRLAIGIISMVQFVTALLGWSVIYFVFRITTRSDKDAKPLDQ